jgi:hypothetical protein
MSTPKNADYKLKQQELKNRRRTVWHTLEDDPNPVTEDGAVYERDRHGSLRRVGQVESESLKLERQRRAEQKASYAKGQVNAD